MCMERVGLSGIGRLTRKSEKGLIDGWMDGSNGKNGLENVLLGGEMDKNESGCSKMKTKRWMDEDVDWGRIRWLVD